jgi:NAD(P)-dependent dehydrogenase (short-subunit alcohol dehydrogenase family)
MGHAISLRLGKDRTMLLADISQERLDDEVAALAKLDIEAEGIAVDVSDRSQVDALAARAAELGVVDTVIHTAGLSPAGAPAEKIISVNAIGTVNMVEAFQGNIAEGGVMIVFGAFATRGVTKSVTYLWSFPEFSASTSAVSFTSRSLEKLRRTAPSFISENASALIISFVPSFSGTWIVMKSHSL